MGSRRLRDDLFSEASAVIEVPAQSYDDAYVVLHQPDLEPAQRDAIAGRLREAFVRDLRSVDAGDLDLAAPQDRRSESPLSIEVHGFALRDEVSRPLAQRMSTRLEEISEDVGVAITATGCVCAGQLPGTRIEISPTFEDIQQRGVPVPYKIALFPSRSVYEALRWTVDRAGPVPDPTKAVAGLASQVQWAKEIVGWNMCRGGPLWRLHVDGPVDESQAVRAQMDLSDPCRGVQTLVFRKPAFLGWWIDHFHFPPDQFSQWIPGMTWTFTWVGDV